jgi:hypothetical protein
MRTRSSRTTPSGAFVVAATLLTGTGVDTTAHNRRATA